MPFIEDLLAAGAFGARHFASFVVIAASCWVFGDTLLERLSLDRRAARWAVAGALGSGLIAQALFFLGVLGWLDRGIVLALLAAAHLACHRTWRRAWRRMARRWLAARRLGLAAVVSLAFLPLFVFTLYPPTGFDATVYHLPYARAFVEAEALPFLPDLRFPVFPQAAEMGFVLGFFLAGDVAAKLTQLLALVLTAGLLLAWGRRLFSPLAGVWAAAFWLGNPQAVWLGASAYVDVSLALYVTAALYAWDRWSRAGGSRWLWLAGAFVGWAAATKYLGLFFLAALALATAVRAVKGRDLRPLAILSAAALLVLAPWYLRIVYYTGNPVFPFYAPIFGASEWASVHDRALPPAAAGAAATTAWTVLSTQASRVVEGLGFLLRVPWTAVFDRGAFNWQAPLSPLYLVLLPLCAPLAFLDARSRWLMLLAGAYGLFWLTTVRDLRFLLAVTPALGLALVATLARFLEAPARARWRSLAVPWLTSLLVAPGLAYAGYKIYEQGPLPVTAEQRLAYLARTLPGHATVQSLNRLEGGDCTVYALDGANLRYYSRCRFLGDVFGPARYSRVRAVLGDGEALYDELRALGACYFLVRRGPYALVPEDAFFDRYFRPVREAGGFELYRLAGVECGDGTGR